MPDEIVEVIVGRQRRRRWSVEEKLRIVAESHQPGARIGEVAARHDLVPGLLLTWRRQARMGMLTERREPLFLPVGVASQVASSRRVERSEQSPSRRIEIELADGSEVRIDDGVSLATLRRVLSALRG
jgi:transposase